MLRISRLPGQRHIIGLRMSGSFAAKQTEVKGHETGTAAPSSVPFAKAKIGSFFQVQPSLGNQFKEDVPLRSFLQRFLPSEVYSEVSPELERFGARVSGEIYELGVECEQNPPTIKHYDGWGKRIDQIVTCGAWVKQKEIAAEEGLIATAYERKYQQWSRLLQIAKLYLYAPSSGLFSCPLAMTDGAAKTLEVLNDSALNDHALQHLISRDPKQFWTSGQWMTERRGGSDVARGTETVAVPQPDGSYTLHGYKWFTSATDSDMALTLARVVDPDGKYTEGTSGISMFYLEVRNADGSLNGIEVQRLKDKLGTRQLPTAELLLDGTRAFRVSEEGRGVASISNMLTLTRIHNAISACSTMRRIINLSRDYSKQRSCFGKIIGEHFIHIKVLAQMEVEARGATFLTLELGRLLGLQDCGMITEHEANVFRLMTPVAKLYTAKQAVAVTSEGLESFGGAGYLEDTCLPVYLRDAQVLPIWEGTTNVLSLDVLRALAKTRGSALKAYHEDVNRRVAVATNHPELKEVAAKVQMASNDIVAFAAQNMDKLEVAGREFAYSLARTYMGMLLIEHACWSGANKQDVWVAKKWCEQDLCPVMAAMDRESFSKESTSSEYDLVFEGYEESKGSRL